MSEETTFFELSMNGRKLTTHSPLVMGIMNITQDSFHEGSRVSGIEAVLQRAELMINEGASILDIGGQSTRPGADRIDADNELSRVIPAIEAVRKNYPDVVISIDTFYAQVAEAAAAAGADIINDVTGGSLDSIMFETVGRLKLPYILTHMQGEPQTMQHNPIYANVVGEVMNFFTAKIRELKSHGARQFILDPGFGFGKLPEHNWKLLRDFNLFGSLGYPVLAGLSRKKTLQLTVGTDAEGALNATTIANTIALLHGASILRVHDVRQAREAVLIYNALMNA